MKLPFGFWFHGSVPFLRVEEKQHSVITTTPAGSIFTRRVVEGEFSR
jgi:hypothetical protein